MVFFYHRVKLILIVGEGVALSGSICRFDFVGDGVRFSGSVVLRNGMARLCACLDDFTMKPVKSKCFSFMDNLDSYCCDEFTPPK
jgi:hypothetical protein